MQNATRAPDAWWLQVIAHNFILGPGAYLKSGWSWIDFVATATGYLLFASSNGNLSGIRALRALRPLRTLNAIPGVYCMWLYCIWPSACDAAAARQRAGAP